MRYIIREKFFHLGEDSQITDEAGQPVFQVDGKLLSLHDRLIMRDMAGNEVAVIAHKLIALGATYEISRGGTQLAEMRQHLFSPFGDRFTVDVTSGGELEVKGNFVEHDFSISRDGQRIAAVSKAWISLTAAYGVDIAGGEDDALILACVLALDLALDRQERR